MKNRNFEDLKIGDVVAYLDSAHQKISLLEVTKVTKATFTAGTTVFNKSTGDARGRSGEWFCPSAWIPTEKEKQEIEKDTKTRRLRLRVRFSLQQVDHTINQMSDDELMLLIQQLRPCLDKRKAE